MQLQQEEKPLKQQLRTIAMAKWRHTYQSQPGKFARNAQ